MVWREENLLLVLLSIDQAESSSCEKEVLDKRYVSILSFEKYSIHNQMP